MTPKQLSKVAAVYQRTTREGYLEYEYTEGEIAYMRQRHAYWMLAAVDHSHYPPVAAKEAFCYAMVLQEMEYVS